MSDEPTPGARDEVLEAAAARARAAREELEAADAALAVLVDRVRGEGVSWRSIARATGIPYREAVVRWGAADERSSL